MSAGYRCGPPRTAISDSRMLPSGLFSRLGIGAIGVNAVWSSAGLVTRAVVQAIYLVLLSRMLGPQDYGSFAGSIAVVVLLVPLTGWGAYAVMHREVSKRVELTRAMWAGALVQILITGSVLVCVVAMATAVLPAGLDMRWMLLLALSELVAMPLVNGATALFQARERSILVTLAFIAVPVGRLLCVAAGMFGGGPSVEGVVVYHMVGTLLGMIVVLGAVHLAYGRPDWAGRPNAKRMAKAGSAFTGSFVLGTSTYEIDKVLLFQLAGASATGVYTVAFRVLSVFAMPLLALVTAALPRLYLQGPGQSRLQRRMLVAAIGYSLIAISICLVFAQILPWIFGPGYEDARRYFLFLLPWLLLYAVHLSLATLLTASDRQGARVLVEAVGLLAIVVLNLLLVPHYGASGTVAALLVSESLIVAGCVLMLAGTKRSV